MGRIEVPKELVEQIVSFARKNSKESYEYGVHVGIRKVELAAEWFHDTYGTEYIVYGEDSIKHLIDIYEEESKVGRNES